MNKLNVTLVLSICSIFAGCAGKKTRLWIEPPIGSDSDHSQKLYYQVEDADGGKKENLIIPIRQMPDRLVIEERKKSPKEETELAVATHADRQIHEGKLSVSTKPGTPTVSYFRGISEVEALYQKKSYSEALVKLAPLLEQYPHQTRLFMMQGTLFKKIGEKKLALEAYKKAQGTNSKDPAIEEAILKIQDEIGENI